MSHHHTVLRVPCNSLIATTRPGIIIQTLRRMAQCESALLSLFVRVARQELAAGFTERAVALFQVRR